MSRFKKILDDLGIDETHAKLPNKPKKPFSSVKANIAMKEDWNFMADTLHLPETKEGFAYLVVLVDLATDEFDMEPIKTLTAKAALDGMNKMFTRKFIKKPHMTIHTDGGPEFKSVFHKYCYDNSILHLTGERGRHKQSANVESLNRQLSRLFVGYMNKIELKTGKKYREWTDVLGVVRTELNAMRKKTLPDNYIAPLADTSKPSKYDVGDIVYRLLDHVEDALGNKQPSEKFRSGDYRWDRQPRKIEQVFIYAGDQPYRYQVSGFKNVSYADWELKPAKEEEEQFEVRKIIGKKKIGNKVHYKVWWWRELKSKATWEPRSDLIKSVEHLLDEYDEEN